MIDKLQKLIIENPKKAKKDWFIGTIYVFYNKVNNKIYVGKTTEKFTSRFNEHRYNAFTKNTINYFYNALRKHGWDNFERYIIFQTDELNDKLFVDKIILEKETYFIEYFNSSNPEFGYNMTEGGDGICGYHHTEETKLKMSEDRKGEGHWNYGKFNSAGQEVLQFDLDFNFIKEWPSAAEVERCEGYKASNISRCCSNDINTYKSYIWVKKSEYYEGYLQEHKSRAKCKSNDKSVLQYDFLGNFINKYISCAEACRNIGKTNISSAAAGTDPQAHGFIWIYEDDFSEELLKSKLERVKKCRFYNKIIKELQSVEIKNEQL